MYNKKVLILEKSGMIRLILKRTINNVGISDVCEASNIAEALNILRNERPNVVCISYVYYEVDNKNIFYDINLLSPGIKILLLSSTPKSEIDQQLFENYHIDFFEKTTDYELLANTIKNY